MKNKQLWGGIITTISALMGIIGHFILFLNWYHVGMGQNPPNRDVRSC